MQREEVQKQIRSFLVNTFLFGQDPGLKSDESLLMKGVIDSTGILELVNFMETTWQVSIDDTEIVPDNLDSIDRATALVLSKTK